MALTVWPTAQIVTVKKIFPCLVGNHGNYYYPGGQVYGSELGGVEWVVSSNDNFVTGKSIAYVFVEYLYIPLGKQDIKLCTLYEIYSSSVQ